MSKGIELSPKHGVNPTIPCCFWCGKKKNQIVLMGRIRRKEEGKQRATGDYEAPHGVVLDYEPCDECAEAFSQGVQLIECVTTIGDERPALTKDENGKPVYPTGRTVVITPESAQRVFNNVEAEMLQAGKKLFMTPQVFNNFMPTDNI